MKRHREDQQRAGRQPFPVQNGNDGGQDGSRRHGAGMKILIHQVEGRSRDGQGEQHRHQRDPGPLRPGLAEQAAPDPQTSPEYEEDGQGMQSQDDDPGGHMRQVDQTGHRFVEYGGLQLEREEIRVMRVQRGRQIVFDGAEIHAVVLAPRMIARDRQAERRKQQERENVAQQRMVFQRDFRSPLLAGASHTLIDSTASIVAFCLTSRFRATSWLWSG